MTHRIQKAIPREGFVIEAVFFNGEIKQYDMKQLFSVFPQFKEFEKNRALFDCVVVDPGGYGVSWDDQLDLDAETIWEDGVFIESETSTDINHLLAYKLIMARDRAQLTQKQLSQKTGIHQADISKIERGLGNPSLSTLKRLAQGLNMKVEINFTETK